MKKILVSTILCLALLLPVSAAPINNDFTKQVATQGGYSAADATGNSLYLAVSRYIKIALSLLGTIFLVLTVYAGYLYMTAGGNEENVTKAKSIIKTSVIGLIIILSAYAITIFVVSRIMIATAPVGQVGPR